MGNFREHLEQKRIVERGLANRAIMPKRLREVMTIIGKRIVILENAQAIISNNNEVLLVEDMWFEENEKCICQSCQREGSLGFVLFTNNVIWAMCPECGRTTEYVPKPGGTEIVGWCHLS
jgi:hypothetical protein